MSCSDHIRIHSNPSALELLKLGIGQKQIVDILKAIPGSLLTFWGLPTTLLTCDQLREGPDSDLAKQLSIFTSRSMLIFTPLFEENINNDKYAQILPFHTVEPSKFNSECYLKCQSSWRNSGKVVSVSSPESKQQPGLFWQWEDQKAKAETQCMKFSSYFRQCTRGVSPWAILYTLVNVF